MPYHLGGSEEEEERVFSEINITPLTDIFLVLLIIFMVGASMAVDAASGSSGDSTSGVQVELPQGSAREISQGEDLAMVLILEDGRVVLEGEEVQDDVLEDRLGSMQRRTGAGTLVVQADEGSHHGRVVRVMEAARRVGFAKLAMATKGEAASP